MIVYIFTDKAEKILGHTQTNAFGEALVVIAIYGYLFYTIYLMARERNPKTGLLIAIATFFTLLYTTIFISLAKDESRSRQYWQYEYSKLLDIYQNQKYMITEGPVNVLHLQPEGGHDAGDIIKVGDVEFELSCYQTTFGYNRTIVFGGVLTEGTFAKIYYYQTEDISSRDRIILRIDLLEQPPASLPEIDHHLPLPCAD